MAILVEEGSIYGDRSAYVETETRLMAKKKPDATDTEPPEDTNTSYFATRRILVEDGKLLSPVERL